MITTTLRIERKLYDTLVKTASKDKRSINSEIKYILEKYLDVAIWYHKK